MNAKEFYKSRIGELMGDFGVSLRYPSTKEERREHDTEVLSDRLADEANSLIVNATGWEENDEMRLTEVEIAKILVAEIARIHKFRVTEVE